MMGKFDIKCSRCNKRSDESFSDLTHVVDYSEKYGWDIVNDCGCWSYICPECKVRKENLRKAYLKASALCRDESLQICREFEALNDPILD